VELDQLLDCERHQQELDEMIDRVRRAG